MTFPAPGPYRVLVDVYPNIPGGQSNFQLYRDIDIAGVYQPRPLPPFRADRTQGGYSFSVNGGRPTLHAIQAQFLNVEVRDPQGRRVKFTPWYAALAHAIFFHAGLIMVGRWGLAFQIAPRGERPFTALIVDQANG